MATTRNHRCLIPCLRMTMETLSPVGRIPHQLPITTPRGRQVRKHCIAYSHHFLFVCYWYEKYRATTNQQDCILVLFILTSSSDVFIPLWRNTKGIHGWESLLLSFLPWLHYPTTTSASRNEWGSKRFLPPPPFLQLALHKIPLKRATHDTLNRGEKQLHVAYIPFWFGSIKSASFICHCQYGMSQDFFGHGFLG